MASCQRTRLGSAGCIPGQANAPSHLVGNVSIDDFGRAEPATVRLADQVLAPAGFVPLIADMPAGVEATIRESKDRRLLFILTTLGEPAIVNGVPPAWTSCRELNSAAANLLSPPTAAASSELD